MPLSATPPLKDRPARERILLTAHELFYREGIRATGVDRVIAESGVAKLTFYRHFPSKNELVMTYLAQRHERWMEWFGNALVRHRPSHGLAWRALPPALAEWLGHKQFRGCAFINATTELGGALPEAADVCRQHKQAMVAAIAALLPPSRQRQRQSKAIAIAVDGAIVQAQSGADRKEILRAFDDLLIALLG